jgi:hypothetical protein
MSARGSERSSSSRRLESMELSPGQTLIPKTSVAQTPGLIRTSLTGPVLLACLFFVPVLTVAAALGLWGLSAHHYLTPNVGAFVVAFVTVLAAGLVWLIGVGMSSIGVVVDDEGVVVFERVIPRGKALRRELTWQSLRNPRVMSGGVWIDADVPGAYLTRTQARVVLNDSRCPIRDSLSPAVAEFIRT